jgi:integrase
LATVYRRGSTWWVRFVWRGQEVRRSARTTSKTVAERMLATLMAEYQGRDLNGAVRHTVAEAIQRFRAEYLPLLKPATRVRYEVSFRQMRQFESLYLDEISRAALADYASQRLRAGVNPATIRRDLNTLSGVLTCAVAWDWADQNPLRKFSKRHLREAPPRTTYPSVEQVERLVAAASPPMVGLIIRFLAATGMRQEEVCGLEWAQVSLARREVLLTRAKTSSPRVVPLGDSAMAVLAEVPRDPISPFVFWHGKDGSRYRRFANAFVLAARKAEVPYRCHDLRHFFASEFLMATGDIGALQRIVGHKTVTMTMRYSHLATRHLHRAMAEFDGRRAHDEPGTNAQHPVRAGSEPGLTKS